MVPKLKKSCGCYPSVFNDFWNDDFPTFLDNNMQVPAINVVENKNEFRLEVAAPGLQKGDFKIKVDHDVLEISAEKEIENDEKDKEDKILRREFSYTSFSRSFALPDGVDTEKIEAKQKDGVIEIILPKKEDAKENKVKEIAIQ